MRESKVTVLVIIAVFILLVGYLFVYQVRVTEVAVHYRPPGRVHRVLNAGDEDESGLYVRLPWPVDKVVKYDRRVRILDGPLPQTQLKDDWQVIISMYAAWRLTHPVQFEESLAGNIKEAENSLKEVIFNETSKAVADLTIHDLVSTDEEQLKFDQLESDIGGGVRRAIQDKGYGIELVGLGVRRIAIPDSTTQKVFERMQAERQEVAQKYKSEGERQKKEILAAARRQAKDTLAGAESTAKRILAEGEAAEAEYYDIFADAPDLAMFLRDLEALRSIARNAREAGTPITFVLDTRTSPLHHLDQGPQVEGGFHPESAVEEGITRLMEQADPDSEKPEAAENKPEAPEGTPNE